MLVESAPTTNATPITRPNASPASTHSPPPDRWVGGTDASSARESGACGSDSAIGAIGMGVGAWTRGEMIDLFNRMIPEFNHRETGKFLDARM